MMLSAAARRAAGRCAQVQDALIVGIRVDSGHQAAHDAEIVMYDLRRRRQAICRAEALR